MTGQSEQEFKDTAIKLQQTLRNFGVGVTVTNISCGPTVTRYELHPEQGVKVSRILSLADDIKLNLAAADIRIEAPIPGKAAVGIEVPNKVNSIVYLRDLLESPEFKNHKSTLAFAVGKDIGGQVVVADLAKMPHLLIAGQTGSGKSVGINTMIMSLIYRSSPDDVKLIMIDPKVVELSVYNGIPHLLIPVVTDPKKAAGALNWAVVEMMDRYNKFAASNVRDLKGYNAKVQTLAESGDIPADQIPKKLPQLVIIIDELADLMMVASNEVEDAICRLAQLARAAGDPSCDRDPASVRQRHHRRDQGERAVTNCLLRRIRRGFENDPRYEWRGETVRKRRYAVLPVRLSETAPCSGRFRLGRRGIKCNRVLKRTEHGCRI